MDQTARLADLLEGSVPVSPPRHAHPELAPGWGRPTDGQPVAANLPEAQSQQATAGSHPNVS